jgi:hypothetical protein
MKAGNWRMHLFPAHVNVAVEMRRAGVCVSEVRIQIIEISKSI